MNNVTSKEIIEYIKQHRNKEKATSEHRFFKTKPGEYGEHDKFLGVPMPTQRQIVKRYYKAPLETVPTLLKNPYHEVRMIGLLILVEKFKRAKKDAKEQKQIYEIFVENLGAANNWDLVDVTVPHVIGEFMVIHPKEKKLLYKLAKSKDLWEKRSAMLACYAFIKRNDFDDALKIAEILVNDKHDLIHKAVGWMLREIGKRDESTEKGFLMKYYRTMPRTMLRYAIEKMSEKDRDFFMGKLN